MRTILILAIALFTNFIHAQIEFGLKAGLNSIDLVSNGIKINNNGSK